MMPDQSSTDESRERVLLVTHCFDAQFSMESRLSWFRAVKAAREFDVTVICAEPYPGIECDLDVDLAGLEVVSVPHTPLELFLSRNAAGFYLAYRLWHRRVFRVAQALHGKQAFQLIHQVSYCGYREPGDCWRLGVPFVWGPIGGTQDVPWRFLGQLRLLCAVKEFFRSVANAAQLRWGRRVGKALQAASAVFAANREVQADFRRARKLNLPCQLETGLEEASIGKQTHREATQPLRILWAGRLESWKGLPLLLRALARLPKDLKYELRVLGSGTQQERWQRMARKLGIAEPIEWIPLPRISERSEHYQWADLFAFTSLRDTSGTGLLESLAAGVPILGLNHQGARDIMTPECAVPIAVHSPAQVIQDLSNSMLRFVRDPELLDPMSQAALRRADCFLWDKLAEEMLDCYSEVMEKQNFTATDLPVRSAVASESLTQVVG